MEVLDPRQPSGPLSYDARMARYDWQEKRALRLTIDENTCRTCGHDGTEYRLEVHHITYERFGDEDVERDLITLCNECHEAITNVVRRRRYENKAKTTPPCNFIVPQEQKRKDIDR